MIWRRCSTLPWKALPTVFLGLLLGVTSSEMKVFELIQRVGHHTVQFQ
ncbi:hypothetical protein SynA1825c_01824 [Synechococcus sp. A18-25c]|nr:hypothetical protein SynA1825c_01824 [Synechococcus sp. A18-25c]